jgi:hypothetical protein
LRQSRATGFEVSSLLGGASGYEVSKVEFSEEDVSKGDFPHYMLKEIFEQAGDDPRRHARPAFPGRKPRRSSAVSK